MAYSWGRVDVTGIRLRIAAVWIGSVLLMAAKTQNVQKDSKTRCVGIPCAAAQIGRGP